MGSVCNDHHGVVTQSDGRMDGDALASSQVCCGTGSGCLCSWAGFGDGSLRHGRMKQLARGGVLNEDMNVTEKLHGPLLGLHQDITLAEGVAFLWYLRHVSKMGGAFYTDSRNVHRYWTRGPEYSTRGQFVNASTSESASTRSVHISIRWTG